MDTHDRVESESEEHVSRILDSVDHTVPEMPSLGIDSLVGNSVNLLMEASLVGTLSDSNLVVHSSTMDLDITIWEEKISLRLTTTPILV